MESRSHIPSSTHRPATKSIIAAIVMDVSSNFRFMEDSR